MATRGKGLLYWTGQVETFKVLINDNKLLSRTIVIYLHSVVYNNHFFIPLPTLDTIYQSTETL